MLNVAARDEKWKKNVNNIEDMKGNNGDNNSNEGNGKNVKRLQGKLNEKIPFQKNIYV